MPVLCVTLNGSNSLAACQVSVLIVHRAKTTDYGEGGRGAIKREGGGEAREVLPRRRGGAEQVLAMLKVGHKKFWVSFYAVA